jgi:hypothetical protein
MMRRKVMKIFDIHLTHKAQDKFVATQSVVEAEYR